jgi:hypothetical protein
MNTTTIKLAKINWENVFNTSHHLYGDISVAWDMAKNSDYPYILWNDRIYTTLEFKDTDYILVDGTFVDSSI